MDAPGEYGNLVSYLMTPDTSTATRAPHLCQGNGDN